jgi:2',3'-cyclic-nucleotide 2'-phosphodiesterase (5'-nucleotidase family)
VEKIRNERQSILVVDSGDLFFDHLVNMDPGRALKKARLIGRAYRRMDASAVNVGDLDLVQGVDFLRSEFSQGLPLISANLLDPSSKSPIFPPFVIREISGMRVAFFGLLPPESGPAISAAIRKANEGKILIRDPVEAGRETLHKLQGRADLVVLLSDLGLSRDQIVAGTIPGIHFILGGHEGRLVVHPTLQGGAYLMQSSARGMYVGKLDLAVENPAFPFEDKEKGESIQAEMRNIERHLQALRRQRERQPSKEVDHGIELWNQRKAKLQEKLASSSRESPIKRNLFDWSLVPLEMPLPEDEEVQRWIGEARINVD